MKLTEGFGRGVHFVIPGRQGLIVVCWLCLLFAAHWTQAQEEHASYCLCPGCLHASQATDGTNLELDSFRIGGRWFTTATDGFDVVRGTPRTLTYGVVPDGTPISGRAASTESTGPSNLVAFLNANVGSQSVWDPLIDDAYQRWAEVSGLTMVRETNDDGATMGNAGASGALGVRPDMRIGGRFIDGQSGSNTLAYNYFPDNSDQVIDTSNTNFYGLSFNNYLPLRNVLMHEAGHGLGFRHFESNNSAGLMEPFINTSFDGPQHDDILAAQRNYGDALEKNGGNDNTGNATGLGIFTASSQTFSIGTDADDNTTFVGANETDFISIDGANDTDVFAFSLSSTISYTFSLLLDPKGPTYNEGAQGGPQTALNTKALVNLELELLDSNGSAILSADANGAGLGELIYAVLDPGDYFARITAGAGAADNVQMYRLDISTGRVAGDADLDGDVDAFDITAVEQNFGSIGDPLTLLGDADGDGDVDAFDISAVEQNFGSTLALFEESNFDMNPEPSTLAIFVPGMLLVSRRRRA